MPDCVVTRFAPSPTGYLHIGGARTALFNWLYAKHTNGKMLLRIEDTDRARSTEHAVSAIIDSLNWLGITYDEQIIYQFPRIERHIEIAKQLLANGNAYLCYATHEQLEQMRTEAIKNGCAPKYNGMWRDKDKSAIPQNISPVIRLKSPQEGETIINDIVQGKVIFQNKNLDDFVLLRSDNTPTYMLSAVVDDHDMGITHIIRGDDHLTNAARQQLIYNALNWKNPEMAHIPLIHGPDGSKLSKRHGTLDIGAYKKMGFLPEAILNALARLGWSHNNDEIFSMEQAAQWFALSDINKGAARFDIAKLEHLNAHYIKNTSNENLLKNILEIIPQLPKDDLLIKIFDHNIQKKLLLAMKALKERAHTIIEIIDGARFILIDRPININQNAITILNEYGREIIRNILPTLKSIDTEMWNVDNIKDILNNYAYQNNIKLARIAQPLRSALTGSSISIGIFDIFYVLGKNESLDRLNDQC